jgi:hypothetical protein
MRANGIRLPAVGRGRFPRCGGLRPVCTRGPPSPNGPRAAYSQVTSLEIARMVLTASAVGREDPARHDPARVGKPRADAGEEGQHVGGCRRLTPQGVVGGHDSAPVRDCFVTS